LEAPPSDLGCLLELQWEAPSDHWGLPEQLLVLPPAAALAGTNRRNVSNWSPSSELEVVRAERVHPLPSPAQHVEQLKEGIRWLQANRHLTKVDEDRHQNEGLWRQVLKLDPVKL
jgi:hypothetical protein